MNACIRKSFKFQAAHSLPNHDGQCRNLHGHSYRVIVEVTGKVNREKGHVKEGMVVDFADISAAWKEHLEPVLDHKFLNDTLPFVTTAENIAAWLLSRFRNLGVPVSAVEVWETDTSCAIVTWGDWFADYEPPAERKSRQPLVGQI